MLTHQTPRGFTVPPNQPSTLVDRDAPDLEREIINKLLPLLADRAFSLFDLADIAGLPFAQLADLLESDRVTRAYNSMLRILAIRQKFLDAQAHFTATAQLLSIASAQPLDAKEADQSRKAANKLEALTRSSPVADGGGGRRSLTEGEVFTQLASESSTSPPTNSIQPPLPPGGPAGEGRGEGSSPSGPPLQPSSPHAHDEIAGFPAPTVVAQLHTACGSCSSWRNMLRAPTHDTQTSQCS